MKKKFLAVLLTLALAVCLLPVYAIAVEDGATDSEVNAADEPQGAAEDIIGGECGDNLTWTLDTDGVLTISGEGDMIASSISGGPWHDYRDRILNVIIENGVTSIGPYAFNNCASISNVTIPNSVTSIGLEAFGGCISLSDVNIPDSVTNISSYAFRACSKLNSISIPNSVTIINVGLFAGCTGLSNVSIPDSIASIGASAFDCCTALNNVTIPNSVTYIGERSFAKSGLTNIEIPSSVTTIGYKAFVDCYGLTEVAVPETVTEIGAYAFGYVGYYDYVGEETVKEDFTLYGYLGSIAETYAEEYSVKFVPIVNWTVTENGNQYEYAVLPESSNTTYTHGSGGTVTVYSTGELDKFVRVLVDGEEISSECYTVEAGSTVLTLLGDYLDTLSSGDHFVVLEYTNGFAKAVITVTGVDETPGTPSGGSNSEETPSDETPSSEAWTAPQTGDNNSMVLWSVTAFIALVGFIATVSCARKRNKYYR